jgi:enterobactin synthetase component F
MARWPDAVPLTEAQEGVWHAQHLDPANPIFNTGQYVDIRGLLDVDAFRDAVDCAADEADALAVRMVETADGPRQGADVAARARLGVVDLRATDDPPQRALEAMRRDMQTPLDCGRDALARHVLFMLDDDRYVWYQRVHHVVIDGYGTALLTARICDLYQARVEGRTLGSGFGSFAGVLAEDASYRSSEQRERDRRFWLGAFADRPDVESLTPGIATTSRTWHRASADAGTAAVGLQALAERTNVAWPDVLIALMAAYIAPHLERSEVVLGVATTNRFGTAAARVPAMVMNVLPVRIPVDDDVRVDALVIRTAALLREARRHGTYRSEQLRLDLGLSRDTRLYGPIVNVLPFAVVPELPGASSELQVLGTGPVDDLTITLRADPSAHGLRIELDANAALYSNRSTADHARRLAAFLQAAALDIP